MNTEVNKNFGRQDTGDLTTMMSEKLMDPTIVERYGTSIKMTMGREYNKYLTDKYETLKKEFSKIDKNSDQHIDFEELFDFFSNYEGNTGVRLSREYLESLYDFMDQDKNNEITV